MSKVPVLVNLFLFAMVITACGLSHSEEHRDYGAKYKKVGGFDRCGTATQVTICTGGNCPIYLTSCLANYSEVDATQPFSSAEEARAADTAWVETCEDAGGEVTLAGCGAGVCSQNVIAPVQNSPGRPSICE